MCPYQAIVFDMQLCTLVRHVKCTKKILFSIQIVLGSVNKTKEINIYNIEIWLDSLSCHLHKRFEQNMLVWSQRKLIFFVVMLRLKLGQKFVYFI